MAKPLGLPLTSTEAEAKFAWGQKKKNTQTRLTFVSNLLVKTVQEIGGQTSLKNYLYSMTKNHILNQFRKNKETISLNYINAQVEFTDDADIIKAMEDVELASLLRKGIDSLPHQKKDICKMKIDDHKSNQEIADEMGLSINTVKSHYQEAIKMLRKYFKQIKLMFF